MTHSFQHLAELRSLLDALCEESITAEQVQRLEHLVLTHPEAEAYYVQYMHLYADLTRCFTGLPAPTERTLRSRLVPGGSGGQEAAPRRPRARRRLLLAGLGLGALAAGLLLALALRPRPGPVAGPDDLAAEDDDDDTVAVLVQAPGARWADADAPPRAGAPLAPGWLRLASGFAQVEFYSGAMVILEGPAELRLISRTEAYCRQGKLRVLVPPQAQGFTIGSPALDLVDRGTEFGLQLSDGRKAEVHVFQGKVELYGPGSDHRAAPHRDLTTGQGIRLDDRGAAHPIRLNPAAFLTARQLADRASSAAESRQQKWLAASDALRRDPDLLVYYPFQPESPWSRTLADQAAGRRHPRDGVIVGCSWGPGRWPGKHGLEFKRVSDRVRFRLPGTYDALTLMAWVRLDALPNRYSSLMMTDGWEPGAPHWHVRQDGKISLGVKGPDREPPAAHYFTSVVFTRERLGQWCHLAVVYDRPGGEVVHYLDGRPVKRVPLKLDVPLHIGNAEVGNWNTATRADKYPVRCLSGCVDEFLIFSRALGGREVEQLYAQGRPPS